MHDVIYITGCNGLCNVCDIVKFILFADDDNIFYSANNLNMHRNVVTQEQELLHNF